VGKYYLPSGSILPVWWKHIPCVVETYYLSGGNILPVWYIS
jgi:hypothetical protein